MKKSMASLIVVGMAAVASAGTVEVELAGQWGGPTNAVDVVGDIAYIGSGPRLLVVGIADPAAPELLGQSPALPGIVHGMAVVGSYAYVADGSIVAWGANSSGQCNVPAPNTDFLAVAAGVSHSLGRKGE